MCVLGVSQCDTDSRPSLCLCVLGLLQGHSEGGSSLTVCSGPVTCHNVTLTAGHHFVSMYWACCRVMVKVEHHWLWLCVLGVSQCDTDSRQSLCLCVLADCGCVYWECHNVTLTAGNHSVSMYWLTVTVCTGSVTM